jgi:hypothetical protein
MNVNTISNNTYQSAIDTVIDKNAGYNKDFSGAISAKDKSDSVEISKEAYDLHSKSENIVAKSGDDYLGVSRGKNNVLIIHFTDSAMVSRTVQRGYITINGVRIDLSDDVKNSLLETDNKAQSDRENAFWLEFTQRNMEAAKQQGEACKKVVEDQAKALETARRIAKGGKVPNTDEKKLMEYNPDLYSMAKMQAMMAKKHKKYDTLYDEEEDKKNNDQTEISSSKTYETTMSVSMEGTPQIQDVSEAFVGD